MLRSGRLVSISLDRLAIIWQVAPKPPLAPPFLKITKIRAYDADLEWGIPAEMAKPITGYIIEWRGGYNVRPDDGGEQLDWGAIPDPITVLAGHEGEQQRLHVKVRTMETIHGLSPGGSYQFRVAAISNIGQGDWSPASRWIRCHAQEPLRPPRPSMEAIMPTSMSISWKQPRNMGAHILHYVLQMKGGDIRDFGEGMTDYAEGTERIVSAADARAGAAMVAKRIKQELKDMLDGMQITPDMNETKRRRTNFRKKLLKRQMKKKRKQLMAAAKDDRAGEGGMVATSIAGLTPGMQYQYRIRAVNRVGASEWCQHTRRLRRQCLLGPRKM